MRSLQLVLLFIAAASTSATIGTLEGVAGGAAALGKSFIGLIGSSLIPTGIFFPLALVGSLKALIGVKALALLKLKLAAPIAVPVAVGAVGKVAFAGHVKAHLVKTAAVVKAAVIEAPVKLMVAKAGAIHGAIAGGKVGLASYQASKQTIRQPEVIQASELLSQPSSLPAAQPEPEVPSYGAKTPSAPAYLPQAPAYTPAAIAESAPIADVPAAPAYVPATEAHTVQRREAESEERNATEQAMYDVFTIVQQGDADQCVRRTVCAIAAQPEIALHYGSEMITALTGLRDDATASWYPYKQAVATGDRDKSPEACAKEYPTCDKNIHRLIENAVAQFD